MKKEALRKSLAAALAYFDVFDYPLTLPELRRFRGQAETADGDVQDPDFSDVLDALSGLPVGVSDGFYHLKGREGTVAERRLRYRSAERKFRRARRFAGFLARLPSVRFAAVCNSLSLSHAADGSDIDLFVVARPGTVWATRLIAAGVLAALGLRPEEGNERDRLCLSFLVSENALDLSGLKLPVDDAYLPYWVATLLPLYDAGGLLKRLIAANSWIRRRIPGVRLQDYAQGRQIEPRRPIAPLLPAFRLFDTAARDFQSRLFPERIRRLMNRDTRVVVNDDILKFHVDDRREAVTRAFRERLAALLPDA